MSFTPFLVIIFSILFIPGKVVSQVRQRGYKTIHVKFKEKTKPALALSGRTAQSGIAKLDAVSARNKASSLRRIFPDAGIYEEAHKAYGLHLWYEIKLPENTTLKRALEDYKATEFFDHVEESRPYSFVGEEGYVPVSVLPTLPSGTNDPLFPTQWHFENTGQLGIPGADINLLKAWQKETGSPNVIVAVIDGGININHSDLKPALWINSDEIAGNGLDDDRNGYIDDIHGYGFGDKRPYIDPDHHGTHVAGIIGAVSNNEKGVSGIAGGNGVQPGVKLMSCATFGNFGIGGFEEAMVYAADNGAVIAQNSWGGGSNAIEAAINYFISRAGFDNSAANFSKNIQTGPMAGGVVIFSAGNDNTADPYYGYPASYEKVIAVASTDHQDVKSTFSNYGAWVDISAPGSNVYSTIISGYGYLSGTSMACPHVSGVAALIVSNLQRPGLTPNQVWNRLRFSARSIDSSNPKLSGQLGWGRLDAFVALKEPDAIPPGAISDLRIKEIHSTSLMLQWTASGEDNNEGQAAEYQIRYSTSPITDANFSAAILAPEAPVPPVAGENVVATIPNLLPATTYYVALKSIDVFNNTSLLSNVISTRTWKLPTPELAATQISELLNTGGILNTRIEVKNTGEEDDLLVRAGVPQLQPASVSAPLADRGRLFAINSAHNTIEEINPKSGRVIHSIPMPELSSKTVEGLAFDGHFLYYGRSKKIYKIDPETGSVIRTVLVNSAVIINGLAWSGQSLYVSRSSGAGNQSIIRVDADNGSILQTLENYYSELAFFGHNNRLIMKGTGRLELIDLNGAYKGQILTNITPISVAYSLVDNLIFVSGNDRFIRAIRPTDGAVMFSIPYPQTTALASHEHPYPWFDVKEETITIPPGQTGEVPVSFIATGLNAGNWTGSVNIISSNSKTNPLPVTVNLTVQSATDIETAKEIDFGKKYMGYSIDTTIVVANRGFTDLIISQVQSDNHQITSTISSVTLPPGQQVNLKVAITPDGPGAIDALLTFTSNDPDEGSLSVPVRATIDLPPAISLTLDSLKAVLSEGESTTLTITVRNTGNSALDWNAVLAGTDSSVFLQSSHTQDALQAQRDSVYKTDLGKITLKSSSPQSLTCLAYDEVGKRIYAKSLLDNSFYIFDPVLNTWESNGITPANFVGQAIFLNGKIYYGGSQLNIYTIQSNTWTSVSFPVAGNAVSLTSDDKFVYVGLDMALYRFDPASGNWLELAAVPAPYYMTGFKALTHHSGVIYATGLQPITGDGNTLLYKYTIESDTWYKSNSISGKTATGAAIDISSARYFVVGTSTTSVNSQMSILDIRYGEWSRIALPFSVSSISDLVFVGKDGASGIYFIQGTDGNKFGYYETPAAPNWFTLNPAKGNLSAGESQVISVNLSAKGLFGGVYHGNVRIYSEYPALHENVHLELKVLGMADVSMSKTTVDVGKVVLGNESGTGLRIMNTGTAELVIDSISVSDPDFRISQTSFTIPVGESRSVNTYFTANDVGKQTGTFTFHSHNPAKGQLQFELIGTGELPAQLEVSTDTIKVSLFTGEIARKKFSINNIGDGSTLYLTISSEEKWLQIDSSGWPVNIGARRTREVEAVINAAGLSQGRYPNIIQIQDYFDQVRTNISIPVLLNVTSAPDLSVSADSLDYGEQFINNQYDNSIEIRNTGFLPLLISSISCDNSNFTISVSAPLNLAPGAGVQATVQFKPTAVGVQIGNIVLNSNDPDQGLTLIKVNGTGVIPPALILNDAGISLTAYAGESQSESINLSNQGGSVLNWKIVNESGQQPSAAGDFTAKADIPGADGLGKLVTLTHEPVTGMLYAQNVDRKLYTYDPDSDTWTYLLAGVPMSVSGNAGAVILGLKMYCTYAKYPGKLYLYDMVLKDWAIKTNPLGFESATITTDGSLIYLAGGGKFASFDPDKEVWSELPIPNFNLDGLGGLSYSDGEIFAHAAGSNSFGKFIIATQAWKNLIPLPGIATLGSAIDPVKKRYYAYWKNYFYEYDITANMWTVQHLSLFEVGGTGALSYSSQPDQQGIYFTQGNAGNGFARYEPRNELAWLRTSQLIGETESMNNTSIGINCNAAVLSPGTYQGKIKFTSNDPNNEVIELPVTFHVKSRFASILIPSLLTDTVSNAIKTKEYLVIENKGEATLEWSLTNELPDWLAVNKRSGSVLPQSKDSIEATFFPRVFGASGIADHTFEITSNDPWASKLFTRLVLTVPDLPITGIENGNDPYKIVASPNPFKNKVKIHLNGYKPGQAVLTIIDHTGKVIAKLQEIDISLKEGIELDGSYMSPGLYTIIISVNNQVTDSIKIMKD